MRVRIAFTLALPGVNGRRPNLERKTLWVEAASADYRDVYQALHDLGREDVKSVRWDVLETDP